MSESAGGRYLDGAIAAGVAPRVIRVRDVRAGVAGGRLFVVARTGGGEQQKQDGEDASGIDAAAVHYRKSRIAAPGQHPLVADSAPCASGVSFALRTRRHP
jgi:hypothetical protein